MRQRASSESSVIYPAALYIKGPPPGMSMHSFILDSSAISLLNSLNDPHASPINAPIIQPKHLSYISFCYFLLFYVLFIIY